MSDLSAPRSAAPVPFYTPQTFKPDHVGSSIPDPSLYFPETASPRIPSNPYKYNTVTPLTPIPSPPPPSHPSQQHLLQPQSDLSHVFHQYTEATLYLQGSGSDTTQLELRERRVLINSSDVTTPRRGGEFNGRGRNYREQQTKVAFPHPIQALESPKRAVITTRTMESVSSTPVPAIAATPPPHSAAPSPSSLPNYHLPPELGQVIAWQNEQLMKLQEQVSALIAASPPACPHTPPACGPGGPSCDTASPHLRKNVVCAATNTNATSNNYSNTNNVATNTSTLWPQLGQCLERLRQDSLERDTVNRDMEAGNREILPWSQAQAQARVSREENNVSVEPNRNIEKSSSYQNTPGEMGNKGPRPSMTSWSSPVLGESVTMYEENRVKEEEEKITQAYENILGNLKRMLAQTDAPTGVPAPVTVTLEPNVSTSEPINCDASHPPAFRSLPPPPPASAPAPPDARDATLERLREMGVSFISPEDLTTPAPNLSSNNSVYLPKASLPSKSIFQDSNSSLDFNSLALKYLNDEQLSQLAVRHQEAQGRKQVTWGTEVPSRQQGPELSMASHQFLARYGLAGSSQPDERTSRDERSPPLLAPNPQPVQPPHHHIERQHIQQSQEPPQYIGNLKHLQQQQNVQQSDEAQYRGLHPRSQPHQQKPLLFPSVRPVNPALPRPTDQNFGDSSLRPDLHLAPCSRPEYVAPPPDHSVPVSQPKAPLFPNNRAAPPVPFSQHQTPRAPQHHNLGFPQPGVPQPLPPATHQFLPSRPETPGPYFRDPPSKPMEERVLDITAIRQQPTLI